MGELHLACYMTTLVIEINSYHIFDVKIIIIIESVDSISRNGPDTPIYICITHYKKGKYLRAAWQWRIQTSFHSFRGNPLSADLKHDRFIQWLLFSVVATS